MRWLPIPFILTASVLAASVACAAQEDPAGTIRADVKLVNVFVTVSDARGAPVGSLNKDDFTIAEDGVAPIQATAVVLKMSCTACQGMESCIQYSIDFIAGGGHVCSIEHYDG